MGRPSKYTGRRIRTILKALRDGLPQETAARLAGIDPTTHWDWLASKPRYSLAVQRAMARGERTLLARVRDGRKGWQGAAWILERTRGHTYASKHRIEHSGPDGTPIQARSLTVDVIANLPDADLARLLSEQTSLPVLLESNDNNPENAI